MLSSETLTLRELRVLCLLADGHPYADIGERLYITPRTVKHHAAAVRRKLGARTNAHAVDRGHKEGLIRRTVPRDDVLAEFGGYGTSGLANTELLED